jgi:photosystem I P700 chlorophyll a apoprotein A2
MRALVGAVTVGVIVGSLGLTGCGGDGDDAAAPGSGEEAGADPQPLQEPEVTTTAPPADTTAPPTTAPGPREVPDSTDPCAAAGIEVEGCADFGNIEVSVTDDDQIVIATPDGERSMSADEAVGELGGEVTDRGIEVPLPDDVLFDFGSVGLRGASRETLSLLAGLALASPEAALDVGGHTDAVGTDDYNQRLSEARAGVVREALVILGVERGRITATGYGETRPVAPNNQPGGADDPAGRQRNRRVEVLLDGARV